MFISTPHLPKHPKSQTLYCCHQPNFPTLKQVNTTRHAGLLGIRSISATKNNTCFLDGCFTDITGKEIPAIPSV